MSYELSNIINSIICADCYDVLKQLPDKSVDLVLTDPPYGIGVSKSSEIGYKGFNVFAPKQWDSSAPSPEFFEEIKRISKNQIIWGGNYFGLPASRCWLVWDKGNGFYGRSYAEVEMAYTSFDSNAKIFKRDPLCNGDYRFKVHPTQKPVPLFKWCLTNYSNPGDLVLDPMCGSGTTALACHALGRRYICIEKESDYVEAARNRLLQFQAQGDLFAGENSALVEECQTNIQQELYAAGSQEPLAGGTCSDEHVV